MSKQLLINERPADNGPSYGGGGDFGAGGGGDWPKASIGNYKGVMLCNRPNELGQQRKPDRSNGGAVPFNSRVMPEEPVGWNPTKKLFPKSSKKKVDPNNILLKHRRFLKSLEDQKMKEKEDNDRTNQEKEEKKKKFIEAAANQRKKIKDMKRDDGDDLGGGDADYIGNGPSGSVDGGARLTEENLKKQDQISQKQHKQQSQAQSKRNKQKPAWAKTEHELEEEKEKEIDDLLEFAYELDYEKFMDDFEVRQALAIIKDRVQEIKKDEDWKTKIAKEWNDAANDDANNDYQNAYNSGAQKKHHDNDDTKSIGQTSFKSAKTGVSKGSLRSQVEKVIQEQNRPEWDGSVKSYNKMSTEERVANRLANEVLRDNAKLRGIHSGQSLQKMLMKEAKKQLMADEYKGPVIQVIKEKELKEPGQDYSNLPYLHKNPAV